jgi:hypothetical protein
VTRMSKEERQAIRQRVDAATPGPWYWHNPDDDVCMNVYLVTTHPYEPDDLIPGDFDDHGEVVAITLLQTPRFAGVSDHKWQENAHFIAEVRTDIPKLLDDLDAADARIAALEEQVKGMEDALQATKVFFEFECHGNLTLEGHLADNALLEKVKRALPPEEAEQNGN